MNAAGQSGAGQNAAARSAAAQTTAAVDVVEAARAWIADDLA